MVLILKEEIDLTDGRLFRHRNDKKTKNDNMPENLKQILKQILDQIPKETKCIWEKYLDKNNDNDFNDQSDKLFFTGNQIQRLKAKERFERFYNKCEECDKPLTIKDKLNSLNDICLDCYKRIFDISHKSLLFRKLTESNVNYKNISIKL